MNAPVKAPLLFFLLLVTAHSAVAEPEQLN